MVQRAFHIVSAGGGGGGGGASFTDFYVAGRYYPGWSGVCTVTGLSSTQILFTPFEVRASQAFDQVAVDVTAAGSTSPVRMGIYNDAAAAGLTLRVDAGTFTPDTTGLKTLAIAETLDPGLYWMAVNSQDTGGIHPSMLFRGSWYLEYVGLAAALVGSGNLPRPGLLSLAGNTAVLPATLALSDLAASASVPQVYLRAA